MRFNEVRSNVPLNDDDYARIRANVRRELRRSPVAGRRSPAVFAFRFAAAAAAIALVALLAWNRAQWGAADLGGASQTLSSAAVTPPRSAAPTQRPIQTAASVPPATVTVHRHRRTQHRKPEFETVRMEIQTADPNVRIIWITR